MQGPDFQQMSAGDYLRLHPPQGQAPPQLPPDAGPQLPQGAGPTLGDTQQFSANNYLNQYEQALQVTRQMVAPAKQDLVHPPPMTPGHLLANILTFGGLGIAEHDAAERHNERAQIYNRGLELHAANLAKDLVNAQAHSQMTDLNTQLNLIRTQLAVAEMERKNFNDAHKREYEQTIPEPANPDEARMREAQGYGPAAHFSGRLQKQPNGTWGLGQPAAPGSAADKAGLGPQGGTSGGGMSSDMQPGESPADYTERKKREAAGKTKTVTEDAAAAAETTRNMELVESWLKDPQYEQATKLLPTGIAGSLVGPPRAYLARRKGDPGALYFQTANTNVMPALRAMEAGAKNMRIAGAVLGDFGVKPQMSDLQNFRMTQQEAAVFKKTLLDRFKKIREQLGSGYNTGPGTTTTTTSTTPSTSGFGTSLDNVLRKHGY